MMVLLIGCGYWGKNWAKTLFKMGKLGAICEPSAALRETLATTYPDIPLYASLDEALTHAGIGACVIATPVTTHYKVARQCLEAGKSVMVEKPITLDPMEAEELVEFAAQQGLTLAVGHLMMYQPALLKLQAMIQEGVLGDILSVQCTRVNLGKVRNEENVWWSLAPHDLSIISMLLGESFRPVSVAKMDLLGRPNIPDRVSASFVSKSGKSASIDVSWLAPVKRHETMVIGTRGIAIFEDTLPPEQKLRLLPYTLEWDGQNAGEILKDASLYVEYDVAANDLLTEEALAFIEASSGLRAHLQNDGQNGLQVVRMLAEVQGELEPTLALL